MKILVEKAVIEQALEALIVAEEFVDRHSEDWYISGQKDLKQIRETITALREALAEQAEQEPVAWMDLHKELGQLRWAGKDIGWDLAIDAVRNRLEELYAAPVRTKDLTDDEIEKVWLDGNRELGEIGFARAVIAAYKEKNK